METKNLGIISWLIMKASKGKPFQSESLDALAETMHVTKILRKSKLDRYYKTQTVRGGLSSFDRIFFDAKYFDILLPEEVLAVGAHEFTHLNQRHGLKRFWRMLAPALIIGAVVGISVFFNHALIDVVPFFINLGLVLSSFAAGLFVTFCCMIVGLYVNAKWLRQQETECDLSSVKLVNGEAMISALIKLNNLRPRKMTRFDRLLPQLYPTLEQRINAIRTAEKEKNQVSLLK
jgi:Zn-dependent protease with chaperone function